jgi:hypothetical protein
LLLPPLAERFLQNQVPPPSRTFEKASGPCWWTRIKVLAGTPPPWPRSATRAWRHALLLCREGAKALSVLAHAKKARLLAWALVLLTVYPGCRDCSLHSQGATAARDASLVTPDESAASGLPPDSEDFDESDPPFGIPSDEPLAVMFRVVGKPDALNRYPAAVMVRTRTLAGEARLRECGGVIVAPQLVLTAGHCVCYNRQSPTPEGTFEYRVEATSCAEAAIVTVFFYEQDPSGPQQIVGYTYVEHRGKVRPHPALSIRLDPRRELLSSHADLAVIHLDTPVPPGFRAARLAKTSAVPGETLTRVGFGYDETLGAIDGRRLVLESKVLKALAPSGERFLLEAPDGYVFRGDAGGPCFRETRRGPMLVGISTTGLGQEPTMTGVRPYWGWVRDELSVAVSPDEPQEPGAPR